MTKLADNRNLCGKELRQVLTNTIDELMNDHKEIVFLEADLGGASGSVKLSKTHPEQYIQCGISEANMAGTAAGMSALGFNPWIHSFAPFATRRIFDQLYLSGAYAKNTINIYGSDPGFTVGPNGGTHTSWEDMALMRTIPGCIIADAADEVQMKWLVKEFSSRPGVKYLRAGRKAVRNIYDPDTEFRIGQSQILKPGSDVLIIACGQLLSEALDAAGILENMGIEAEVLDPVTIKPLDEAGIVQASKDKKAIVTFENHSITGGLGSAVSEILMENDIHAPFKRHGIKERFGQVGTPDYLQKEFGLTARDLVEDILGLLSKRHIMIYTDQYARTIQ